MILSREAYRSKADLGSQMSWWGLSSSGSLTVIPIPHQHPSATRLSERRVRSLTVSALTYSPVPNTHVATDRIWNNNARLPSAIWEVIQALDDFHKRATGLVP